MLDRFERFTQVRALPDGASADLERRGFVVIPEVLPAGKLTRLASAYDLAMSSASSCDLNMGSTTTRVSDLVNRGADFDEIYILAPLLEACCQVIGQPFKLSSLHARTLRPHTLPQELHVDVPHGSGDWPLLGFILMIDEFRQDNGATGFVSGSHKWLGTPDNAMLARRSASEHLELACGPAGSLLVFDGSTWHGHTANISSRPRRSIQGAFIPRGGQAAVDFAARMQPETRARLSELARLLLLA
jgi:hypothetical protein